ncbi:hypothetical protein GL218_05876 [Daldinia childiae]|uniref:uncharacterized protein n=1 Tax=Daldinia childiae TaxID=326645 RepID=UPI001444E6C5|nr:uncharacterized protein GL218_05876 [Daldinia childiae]KAF3057960.1 hypothetical protein GL218_05876 [Daldinia childiae]
MSSDEAQVQIGGSDKAIWLSYAKGVQQQIVPTGLGANDVLYVCPPTYVSLGVNDRAEDINRDVEKNAGAMLPTTASALFVPSSASERYFLRLRTLSNCINPTPSNMTVAADIQAKINEARTDKESAETDYTNATHKAWDDYSAYLQKAKRQHQQKVLEYKTWSETNASDLGDYRIGVANATSSYHSLLKNTYGQQVQNMIDVQVSIAKAIDEEKHPGFNMPTIFADVASDKAINKDDIAYVPAYSLSGYGDLLTKWKKSSNTNYHNISVSVNNSKNLSWTSFGHSESLSDTKKKVWIVFNESSSSEEKDKHSAEQLEDQLNKVDFNLKVKEWATIPITRGNWDHPNIRKNFKFVSDTPAEEDYVVPTAMLIGYGVGLEATFQSEAKKSAKDAIDHFSKTAESGMRILGINIQPSKSNMSSSSTSKSDVKFDSENGKISISPENNLYVTV